MTLTWDHLAVTFETLGCWQLDCHLRDVSLSALVAWRTSLGGTTRISEEWPTSCSTGRIAEGEGWPDRRHARFAKVLFQERMLSGNRLASPCEG